MGDTSRGAAKLLTDQRTDQMIVIISLGIVFALTVGGFVMAANIYGDQDRSPVDDPLAIILDDFDLVETAQPQALREPSFVWESESGSWGPLCTEQGYIEIVSYNIPQVLDLCIDNEYLAQWYVEVFVYGGYQPWGGYIDVWQKGEFQGRICIEWTYRGHGPCCASEYWVATFYTQEPICLESNQYPDVAPWVLNHPADQMTIPGKCVYLDIMTYWTGCVPGDEPSQDFTIVPTQSCYVLSQIDSSSRRK